MQSYYLRGYDMKIYPVYRGATMLNNMINTLYAWTARLFSLYNQH